MPTGEKQLRRFSCVVECLPLIESGRKLEKQEDIKASLDDLAFIMPTSYWAIVHDMDYDDDTGEVKRPHIHIVLETRTRHTFLGVVRKISEAFGIAKERVSVRETRNENASIRYLMHMDDPEKQPYLPFDVMTNDKEGLNVAILNSSAELNIEELIEIIANSRNELEVARKIGLKNYQRYRGVIRDLAPIVGGEKLKRHIKNIL